MTRTGDEKAKEAALRSADGVVLRQVNRFRDKPNAGDQSRSSGWAILVLCSAYDITGDRKWLDEALILWNNNLKVKWKEKNDEIGIPLLSLFQHSPFHYSMG